MGGLHMTHTVPSIQLKMWYFSTIYIHPHQKDITDMSSYTNQATNFMFESSLQIATNNLSGYTELCQDAYLTKLMCLFVPMAQTSTGGPYCVSPTSSSGALYHLVATYSVYSPPGPAVKK